MAAAAKPHSPAKGKAPAGTQLQQIAVQQQELQQQPKASAAGAAAPGAAAAVGGQPQAVPSRNAAARITPTSNGSAQPSAAASPAGPSGGVVGAASTATAPAAVNAAEVAGRVHGGTLSKAGSGQDMIVEQLSSLKKMDAKEAAKEVLRATMQDNENMPKAGGALYAVFKKSTTVVLHH